MHLLNDEFVKIEGKLDQRKSREIKMEGNYYKDNYYMQNFCFKSFIY